MSDITRQEAEEIATSAMNRRRDANELVIDKSKTREYPFGWVIIMLTKRYMETKIPDLDILGLGYFIVTRDGSINYIPTNISPDLAIDWYTKQWKALHGR